MRRQQTRARDFDLSIHRDELEQDRRLLENRLKSNVSAIPAPPIASDDDGDDDPYHYTQNSSVEVPRHMQEPIQPDFPSFAHRSREHLVEEDGHMQMGWSYRTGDDDEGINPYGGGDASTVGHHISAVTVTAGLGGGRNARRADVSISGAEYDPDRPLNRIMAGVGRLSMFDETSRSKTNNITFEPLVVDSTAELDRILQSGFAPQNQSVHPTPPTSNASSSSSLSEPPSPSRPKLADHLRTLAFSPKRPRTTAQPPASPLAKRSQAPVNSTPRPARRPAQPQPQPTAAADGPTPSSRFTRMARGLKRDIADEANKPPSAPPMKSSLRSKPAARDLSRSRIHLPDVTGLSAAVESPARLNTEYKTYKGAASREAEARFLKTLGLVQGKLEMLNEENGISRRRVRELEMELDECKRSVGRERSKLLEKEDVLGPERPRDVKGKGRAQDGEDGDVMKRYKMAVEEKKSLEALINSLRSHLTRLTEELTSHSQLLKELKELRETDTKAIREKGNEINRLNEEVERLAGEIEVLRGVVEEGLRERRAGREPAVQHEEADTSMDMSIEDDGDHRRGHRNESEDEDEEEETAQETIQLQRQQSPARPGRPLYDSTDEDEDDSTYEPEPSFLGSPNVTSTPAGQHRQQTTSLNREQDKTVRTDHATIGSTTATTATPHRVQFIDQQELKRIEREVAERRNELSFSAGVRDRQMRSRTPPIEPISFYEKERPARARTPVPPLPLSPSPSPQVRPAMLGGARMKAAAGIGRKSSPVNGEAPFPQIRGERLEKLFFDAPAHNPRTCSVCFRGNVHGEHDPYADLTRLEMERGGSGAKRSGRRGSRGSGVDVEFEGEIDDVPNDASYFRNVGTRAGLPPQTVAMRVIRELEDDFTHYKSVYVELADQYKDMDPVSDVPRRNLLAKHLKEVVDILEQKGDQIASLSDLLAFKEKEKAGTARK